MTQLYLHSRIFRVSAVAACFAILLATALLSAGPRRAVDWSRLRVVAFESDDWGLPGFFPSRADLSEVQRHDLATGSFPAVYWGSTLEDSLAVARVCAIMSGYHGQDGLPAVFQPNYVTGSMEWVPDGAQGRWVEYSFPEFPRQYSRPGMLAAVQKGIQAGVWYPELHARWHYDPVLRRENALQTELSRDLTARGVMLFPGSEKARELGPWRPAADLARELEESREIFKEAFGRQPGSIIAPDYTWNPAMESIWHRQGLRVIQAKREQRNPELGGGKIGRAWKFLQRQLDQQLQPRRHYLERNVRLEPVQAPDPGQVVRQAVTATRAAWNQDQPAIVETHRVNFVHLDPDLEESGRQALGDYLEGVNGDPQHLPTYLTDAEIAQLKARGTSWIRRGDRLILRNGTRSTRVLAVPSCQVPGHPGTGLTSSATAIFRLAAGQTLVLPALPGSR